MTLFALVSRLMLIWIVFAVPLGVMLGMILGEVGAGVALIGTSGGFLLFAILAESLMLKVCHAGKKIPEGLAESMARVMKEFSGASQPKLFLIPDPAPLGFVVCSLIGSGGIFLSQGLIASLCEGELRAVLKVGVLRLQTPGVRILSLFLIFSFGLRHLAPKRWTSLIFGGEKLSRQDEKFLSPISAVGFLLCFPFAKFLNEMGSCLSLKTEVNPRGHGTHK